ncbi:MAG TPA: hypothetical protein VMR41_05360 [Patescibacteria group bacterium]|nr:hypothetical protein [Patescibacteria group bacterium]
MIDSVQFVLLFVIVVLTILLVVLGVQVFFILREIKSTLFKANKVLDTAGTITEAVSGPLSNLGSFGTIIGSGSLLTVAKIIKAFLRKDTDHHKHSEE